MLAIAEGGTGTGLSPDQLLTLLDTAVDGLAQLAVEHHSVAGLHELIAGMVSATSRLTGVASRALGELHVRSGGQVPGGTGSDQAAVDGSAKLVSTAAWLRRTTRLGGRRRGAQLRTATASRELPRIAQAVMRGEITAEHASVVTRLVAVLGPEACWAAKSS